jgi:hypothetical protein
VEYQSGVSHIEHASGCCGAEAILDGKENAMVPGILQNLQVEDDVNGVLEKLWPCRSFGLCHLSDDDEKNVLLLSQATQDVATFSYLRGTTG